MKLSFSELNKDKNRAYLILLSIVVVSFLSFQNFSSSEGSVKPNVDVSEMLKSSQIELQQTKSDLRQDIKMPSEISEPSQVSIAREPMRIKLKRAPAKSLLKTKAKKKKKHAKKQRPKGLSSSVIKKKKWTHWQSYSQFKNMDF